jgi:hypothetical protein
MFSLDGTSHKKHNGSSVAASQISSNNQRLSKLVAVICSTAINVVPIKSLTMPANAVALIIEAYNMPSTPGGQIYSKQTNKQTTTAAGGEQHTYESCISRLLLRTLATSTRIGSRANSDVAANAALSPMANTASGMPSCWFKPVTRINCVARTRNDNTIVMANNDRNDVPRPIKPYKPAPTTTTIRTTIQISNAPECARTDREREREIKPTDDREQVCNQTQNTESRVGKVQFVQHKVKERRERLGCREDQQQEQCQAPQTASGHGTPSTSQLWLDDAPTDQKIRPRFAQVVRCWCFRYHECARFVIKLAIYIHIHATRRWR